MKIILLRDIPKLGLKFDIKEVNAGYAKNFLLPQKMAKVATTEAISHVEKFKEQEKKMKSTASKKLEELSKKLKSASVILEEKASKTGKLFAALENKKVEIALKDQLGLELNENIKVLIEKSIKTTGEHKAYILSDNKKIPLSIVIKPLKEGKAS